MYRRRLVGASALLGLCAPSAVYAATLEVGPGKTYSGIQDAVDAASDGDDILVYADTYDWQQISISKDLTITGVSGSGSTRIRWEDGTAVSISDAVVTFSGFTIRESRRGMRVQNASVVMDDVVFDNNGGSETGGNLSVSEGSTVTWSNGSADSGWADSSGGNVYVSSSTLSMSSVDVTGGQSGSGGGLYATDAIVSWNGGSLDDNQANESGAGIYAGNGSALTLVSVDARKNQADGAGGGAYVTDGGTKLLLSSTTWTSNDAGNGGAAIYVNQASVTSTSSTFSSHSIWQSGAAVSLASSTWDGVGDVFSSNKSSSGYGGAIYLSGTSSADVTGSTFSSNSASRGGAVYAAGSGNLSIASSTFTSNSASSRGGAVGWGPSSGSTSLTIADSVFTSNATTSTDASGGAVYAGDGAVTLTGDAFTSNSSQTGGAVALSAVDAASFTSNELCGNSAAKNGGGVYAGSVPSIDWRYNVLTENKATGSGGAAYFDSSTPTIVNNTFLGNQASTDGGAVYFNNAPFAFDNNVLAWTVAGNGVSADALATTRAYSFTYNDWYSNTAANLAGGFLTSSLDATNLLADPELTAYSLDGNCANDRPWPKYGSPLVDAGDPTIADPDGSRSDVGAYGGPGADASMYADADGDGYIAMFDCDDASKAVHPGATEVCNGADDDCDGTTDVGAADATTWYADADGDGYGGTSTTISSCSKPSGYYATADDCNDADARFHPGAAEVCGDPTDYNCDGSTGDADADFDGTRACEDCDDQDPDAFPGNTEVCDGKDDDCDGQVDEADAADATLWYADADGDGYGNAYASVRACDPPTGYVADSGDCNDASTAYHPGATETCDVQVDYNCDGSVGADDKDGDGWIACQECDDGDAAVNPSATETCDGKDDDCDGEVDENGPVDGTTWYADADRDGYGDPNTSVKSCDAPDGYVADGTDCDDGDPTIHPDADDPSGDGVDADCDGVDGTDGGDVTLDKGGCSCDSGGAATAGWLGLLLGALTLRRRRV